MDSHNKYLSHHRQSLRPGSGTAMTSMLASRYGIQLGGTSTGKRGSTSTGSLGSSPIRSRSNSTSRFKAAAAVAVAAATGNKQFGNSSSSSSSSSSSFYHRPSISPASFNLRSSTSGGSSTITSSASSSSTSSSSTTSGANCSSSSSAAQASSSSSYTSGSISAAQGVGAGISSTVVSFMKKFVNKATPNSNISDNIDQSIEQYQKQQQQQQQQQRASNSASSSAQSPTKYLFTAITGSNSGGGQTADTGYSSSNMDSPVTTPTPMTNYTHQQQNINNSLPPLVPGSSQLSTSPSCSNANNIMTTCSPTDSLNSMNQFSVAGCNSYISNHPTTMVVSSSSSTASSRPTSAASSVLINSQNNVQISNNGSSARNGPIFSKIRAKVASTFQQQQQIQSVDIQSPSTVPRTTMAIGGDQIGDSFLNNQDATNKARSGSISSTSGNNLVGTPVGASGGSPTTTGTGYQRAPMLSMMSSQSSSLTNEQLTAHLTDEERQILQKVWQKEEEFREIALKNFNKNMTNAVEILAPEESTNSPSTTCNNNNNNNNNQMMISSGQTQGNLTAVSTGSVSHLSTNLLDPVAAAVHRRRSSAIMSADATGFCRICRKIIMKNETSHRCSNCQELVCDDCSSYSSRDDTKYWMCSFCRRRGSHLVLVTTSGSTPNSNNLSMTMAHGATGTSTVSLITDQHSPSTMNTVDNSNVQPSMAASNQQRFLSTTATPLSVLNTKRKLSFQELQRPQSAFDQYGNGQPTGHSQQQQQQQQRLQQQPNQHQQTSSQQAQNRQSSLDLSRAKPEMMKFSRNLPQIPIQQSQQQQPPQPSPSPQPANNQLHPNNIDTNRTRIYSLSDDEELWNDDDDDDDDDGDDDDDLGGNGNEMNDNDDDDDDDDDVIIMLKDHVEQDQQVLDDYAHYGTLQTVPVEQLKLQRLLNHKKKKKKKKHPHSAQQGYNSDDELLMANSYGKGNQDPLSPRPPAQTSSVYSSTPPITITSLDDPDDPILTVTTNQASASGDVGDQLMMIQQPSLSSSHFPTTRSLPQQPPSLQNTSGVGVSYQQCQTKQPKVGNINLIGGKPLPASAITAAHWWRLTNKARSLCRANGGPEAFYGTRKQHSSESSDFSDGFKYSPPQESLTPSSEYSRSPRESVDSDMLGLNQYHSSNMSRAIPSVMIGDVSGGGGASTSPYLSTKDCYLRRGSAGRALPKIPLVASGSSMLDLPHSRKNSQQSLDIPAEQPRRASAPESGDPIRIVIDEPTDLSAGHLESTATSTGSIDQITTKMASPLQTSMVRHHRQPHHQTPGPSIIQVPNTATLQQRMRYQLSRAASITTHYERVVLQRDQTDQSTRTRGFSLAITGGKLCEADGMLYAYVTWIKPGGQADSNLLKSGDKILEWNGKSLVNCSHEQVCNIMDISGDMAELIIESMVRSDQPAKRRHSLAAQQPQNSPSSTSKQQTQQSKTGESSVDLVASTASSATSTTICARPSSAAALISTTASGSLTSIQSIASSASTNIGNHVGSLRRRLPQIPTQQQSQMGSTSNSSASSSISMSTSSLLSDAQIFLQVTIDANIRQLSVMIIQAKGLDRHPIYVQNPGFEAYAQLRLLPEMGFKICQTELSRPFDWNETLIYHQFPLERIEKITLDLSVWCTTPSTYIPGVGAGGSRSPRITVTGATIAAPPDYQLASTRIPLRSALLMHISEWWPLIPCNMEQPASLPLPPTLSFNSQSSLADSTSTSMAPTVFFQKAPSMDHIGDDPSALLSDQMMRIAMTSHSTPGSRRNSSRNEQNDQGLLFGNQTGTNQSMLPPKATSISARVSPLFMGKTSATPPPPASASWFQRYRSSPSRASATSILSSNSTTGGRHSLDESYSITNSARSGGGVSGPPSLSCKFTSLRSTPNRHSIGNLYQIGPNGGPRLQSNAQQQQQSQLLAMDNLANRRKSSSALTQGSRNKLFVPGSSRGYNQFGQTDSYQYLLEQTDGIPNRSNSEMGYQSDQESELDTSDDDEDFANLLKDSSYTLDSLDNRPQLQTSSSPIKISSPEKDGQKPMDKIPTMDMPDKNLLSIDVHGSRYSVATTSDFRTPSHDEDFEDDNSQNGGLTIPVCQERRPSFLRRLMPSAAETVMNMVMGGPASNAQPSDEILHPITGIGGQPGSTTDSLASEHPKRRTIVVVGEIKLGFVMTKGFLEIEVIAARNLPDSSFGPHPPDTYVKTYLVDRGRQLYKRKTRVVSSDKNPQYRQTLKYDASIIYGRTLLVSVWEKQHRRRTFDTNTPIGSVEINVNQLQLHKLTIRWFKLRSLVENQAQQTESFDDNEITANIAIGSSSGDHHQPPASLTG